ncbi:MAG: hypothetical protein CMK32_09605 [Porticoccaceae bacterium]|nr:hypothetical protein [Porticoccaceae bacterium]
MNDQAKKFLYVIPEKKPTGWFILPDGRKVNRHGWITHDTRVRLTYHYTRVVLKTRWVTYGPEDIDYLVYAGLIKEEFAAPRDQGSNLTPAMSLRFMSLDPGPIGSCWGYASVKPPRDGD